MNYSQWYKFIIKNTTPLVAYNKFPRVPLRTRGKRARDDEVADAAYFTNNIFMVLVKVLPVVIPTSSTA